MTNGKPLGFPGFLPAALLCGAITALTAKNTIIADSEKITFENRIFLIFKTSFSENWQDITEIRLVPEKRSIYTIHIVKGETVINTFIRGSKEKTEEIAEKLKTYQTLSTPQTP